MGWLSRQDAHNMALIHVVLLYMVSSFSNLMTAFFSFFLAYSILQPT